MICFDFSLVFEEDGVAWEVGIWQTIRIYRIWYTVYDIRYIIYQRVIKTFESKNLYTKKSVFLNKKYLTRDAIWMFWVTACKLDSWHHDLEYIIDAAIIFFIPYFTYSYKNRISECNSSMNMMIGKWSGCKVTWWRLKHVLTDFEQTRYTTTIKCVSTYVVCTHEISGEDNLVYTCILKLENCKLKRLSTRVCAKTCNQKIATSGNRTRASRVAGENSTTEPTLPHDHGE